MNKNYQIISPDSGLVLENKDIYIVQDHVPHFPVGGLYFDKALQGQNTINEMFYKNNIDIKNKFFIVEDYLIDDIDCKAKVNLNYIFLTTLEDTINDIIRDFSNISFLDKKTNFNCPMNKFREHRGLVSWWLAKNKEISNYFYTQLWNSTDENYQNLINELLHWAGINSVGNNFLNNRYLDDYVESVSTDNVDYRTLSTHNSSFNKIFKNSWISVVTEPPFYELGTKLDEKIIAPYAGLSVPIGLNYRIYEILEKLGFDTFSDIINTQYQYIKHPVLRTIAGLEANRDILKNADTLFANDYKLMNRLVANYQHLSKIDTLVEKSLYNFNLKNNLETFKQICLTDAGLSSRYQTILKFL